MKHSNNAVMSNQLLTSLAMEIASLQKSTVSPAELNTILKARVDHLNVKLQLCRTNKPDSQPPISPSQNVGSIIAIWYYKPIYHLIIKGSSFEAFLG